MFLCDYHTHTRLSFDGDPAATHDAMCRRALEMGLSDIAFTDHCDVNAEAEGYPLYAAEEGFAAMQEVRAKYAGRLNVLCGIELGNAHHDPDRARAVLAAYPYDFVIGSLHNLRGVPDFYYINFEKMPDTLIHRLFDRALDETREMIECPGITSLGHLTYMHRYVTQSGRACSFVPHLDKIRDIFTRLVERQIALELNVSTLHKGLGITLPTAELLKLYVDCGGRLVTIGSDAHDVASLGREIRRGYAALRAVGLSEVMTVSGGERVMRSIL